MHLYERNWGCFPSSHHRIARIQSKCNAPSPGVCRKHRISFVEAFGLISLLVLWSFCLPAFLGVCEEYLPTNVFRASYEGESIYATSVFSATHVLTWMYVNKQHSRVTSLYRILVWQEDITASWQRQITRQRCWLDWNVLLVRNDDPVSEFSRWKGRVDVSFIEEWAHDRGSCQDLKLFGRQWESLKMACKTEWAWWALHWETAGAKVSKEPDTSRRTIVLMDASP